MGEADEPGPVTEPVIQTDTFATETVVEPIDGNIRIVSMVDVEDERRIVSRVVIPVEKARLLVADLRRVLARGGN
jgi:hypothetical protein